MKDASRLPHVNGVAERPEACVIMFGREGGIKNSVPTVFFITHPDVAIDPSVPVPEWPLNERGRARMRAMIAHPWARGVRRIFASNERKARDGIVNLSPCGRR
jgi:hypothetical protein